MKKLSLLLVTTLFCSQLHADPMSDLTQQISNQLGEQVSAQVSQMTQRIGTQLQNAVSSQLQATLVEMAEPAETAQVVVEPLQLAQHSAQQQ